MPLYIGTAVDRPPDLHGPPVALRRHRSRVFLRVGMRNPELIVRNPKDVLMPGSRQTLAFNDPITSHQNGVLSTMTFDLDRMLTNAAVNVLVVDQNIVTCIIIATITLHYY